MTEKKLALEISIPELKCIRCGHKWYPTKPPERTKDGKIHCPKCKGVFDEPYKYNVQAVRNKEAEKRRK